MLVLTYEPVVPGRIGMRLDVGPHKIGKLDRGGGVT